MGDDSQLVIFPARSAFARLLDSTPLSDSPSETIARLRERAVRTDSKQERFVFEGPLSEEDLAILKDAGAKVFSNQPMNLIPPIGGLEPPKSGGALKGPAIRPQNNNTVPAHGADVLHNLGIKGKGVNVVIIDTGLGDHSELPESRVTKFDNAFTPGEETPADRNDGHGHGTHVSGTAVGEKGMAPEANIMSIQVLDEQGRGTLESILNGIDRAIEWKKESPNEPMVISMSLGGTATTAPADDPMVQKIEEARAAGIVVVIAAGNSGPNNNTIGTPGIAPKATTAAASDLNGTPRDYGDDKIADFSSRGSPDPNASNGQNGKPDIAANGVNVTSTIPGNKYATWSGTSMATPAVSGAMALLLGYAKDLETQGMLKDGATVKDLIEDQAFARVLYWSSLNNESTPGHVEGAGTMRVDEAKNLFDRWYGKNATEEPPADVEPPWSREGESGDGGGGGGDDTPWWSNWKQFLG